MKKTSTSSLSCARGFTLVELLVAMAITTIIIAILVSITSLSLDTWNRSRSEIRAARQGKAMIDSMSRDFESMVVRRGNNFEWLYAAFSPSTNGPRNNLTPNAANLVFFSAATDRYSGNIGDTGVGGDDKGGDVSTVAYQLKYQDPMDSSGGSSADFRTFVLYRKVVNPDVTFNSTLGLPFSTSGTDLLNAAQNAAADGSSSAGTNIDSPNNFICENVYQFTTTFHVQTTRANGTTATVPVNLGGGSGSSQIFKVGGSGLEMDNSVVLPTGVTLDMLKAGRLTSVEVSLTVLTDAGLKGMQRRPMTGADLDDFVAQNSYQYSKLIPVPGS